MRLVSRKLISSCCSVLRSCACIVMLPLNLQATSSKSMELGPATLALYAAGATALATSFVKLKTRLQLSRAKHPSLTGHSRMARRIAALLPILFV